jgi:hypothetical protein
VEQVLDGDLVDTAFTTRQLADLEKTLLNAERSTGAYFSTYVGKLVDGRNSAIAIHRQLANPPRSALIAVDPQQRVVEVVTGAHLREALDDPACRLACLTMTSRFAIGDIAAGLRDGVVTLADHAREIPSLHTSQPE